MNPFTDILFIFVFVFVILHFGLIDIEKTDIVRQKIYMFLAVSIFASFLYVLKSVRKQCPVHVWNVISSGLLIGLLAYIGHTLLFDLWYNPTSQSWLKSTVDTDFFTLNILLSSFIAFSIAVGKSLHYLFDTSNPCN